MNQGNMRYGTHLVQPGYSVFKQQTVKEELQCELNMHVQYVACDAGQGEINKAVRHDDS